MHNHSGPAPEFISLQSAANSSTTAAGGVVVISGEENTTAPEGRTLPKRGRGRGGLNNTTSTSHRGRYGPPNYPRGLVSSTTRSKRKREPTSGQDSGEDSTITTTTTTTTAKHLDLIRMPWHPPGLSRYSPGIVGYACGGKIQI